MLRNCAGIYANRIARKECILITVDDHDTVSHYENSRFVKPIALGDYRLGRGWIVISQHCNTAPSPRVRQLYEDYGSVLEAWWTKYLAEEKAAAAEKRKRRRLENKRQKDAAAAAAAAAQDDPPLEAASLLPPLRRPLSAKNTSLSFFPPT